MKIQAYRCTWDGDPGCIQYHDHTDPLPDKWDDESPDEVAALVANPLPPQAMALIAKWDYSTPDDESLNA